MEEIKKGKIDVDRYRVKPGTKVHLEKYSTGRDVEIEKEEVKEQFFPEVMEELSNSINGMTHIRDNIINTVLITTWYFVSFMTIISSP